MHISPTYTLQQLRSGQVDGLEVFRDQIDGWLLDSADELVARQHGGFAALMLCASLFERLEAIEQGQPSHSQSAQFFAAGLRKAFSISQPAADKLYRTLRCGLYHEAALRRGVVLNPSGGTAVNEEADGNVVICPCLFVADLRPYFSRWIASASPAVRRRIADEMSPSPSRPTTHYITSASTASPNT